MYTLVAITIILVSCMVNVAEVAFGHEHNYRYTVVLSDGTEQEILIPKALSGGFDGDHGEYADKILGKTGSIDEFMSALGVNAKIITGDGVQTLKYIDSKGHSIIHGIKPYMAIPPNIDKIFVSGDILTIQHTYVIPNPIGDFTILNSIKADSLSHLTSWNIPTASNILTDKTVYYVTPERSLTFSTLNPYAISEPSHTPIPFTVDIEGAGDVSIDIDKNIFVLEKDRSFAINGKVRNFEFSNQSTLTSSSVNPLFIEFKCKAIGNIQQIRANHTFTFNGNPPITSHSGPDGTPGTSDDEYIFLNKCDDLDKVNKINRQHVNSTLNIFSFNILDRNPFGLTISNIQKGKYFEIIGVDSKYNNIGIIHSGLVPDNGIIEMIKREDATADSLSGSKVIPGTLIIYANTPKLIKPSLLDNNLIFDMNNNEIWLDNILKDRIFYDVRAYVQIPITQKMEVISLNLTTPIDERTNIGYLEGHYNAGTYIQVPIIPGRNGFEIAVKAKMPDPDGGPDLIDQEGQAFIRYGDILGGKTLHVITDKRADFSEFHTGEILKDGGSLTVRADTIVVTDQPLKLVFTISASGSLYLENTYTLDNPSCDPPQRRDPLSVSVEIYVNGKQHTAPFDIGINTQPEFTPTPADESTTETLNCQGGTAKRAVLYEYPSLTFSGNHVMPAVNIGDYVEFFITTKIEGEIDTYTPPAPYVITDVNGHHIGHIHLNAAVVRVGH